MFSKNFEVTLPNYSPGRINGILSYGHRVRHNFKNSSSREQVSQMSFWKGFGSGKLRECEEKALKEPENPQCHFELGTEYERRGQYPQAIEAFQQTLKLNPRSAETHFNLGVLYEISRNGRKAIFHMVQAGNLFSERNDTENKDKARKKLKEYYKQFNFHPEDNPPAA